jgi:nitrate reductase cytochrome c-type subunit
MINSGCEDNPKVSENDLLKVLVYDYAPPLIKHLTIGYSYIIIKTNDCRSVTDLAMHRKQLTQMIWSLPFRIAPVKKAGGHSG